MKYDSIIFDLDGTLINTLEDLGQSMNLALEDYKFPIHSIDCYKNFLGGGVIELVRNALPEKLKYNEDLILRVKATYHSYYQDLWNKTSELYDGIDSLLSDLKQRGIKLNILSNKPHEFTIKVYNKYFSKWNFNQIFGHIDGYQKKPDPLQVHNIIKENKTSKEKTLFMGDTNVDLLTAKNAGVDFIGVSWGFRTFEELSSNGARIILKHPLELFESL